MPSHSLDVFRFLRRVPAAALSAAMLIAASFKIWGSAMGDGNVMDATIGAVEIMLALLLWTRAERLAALGSIGICLAGVLWSLVFPHVSCRCLGPFSMSSSQHLVVAGVVGLIATAAYYNCRPGRIRLRELSIDLDAPHRQPHS